MGILWGMINPMAISMGLFAGFVFGFLLRKGHVTRFDTIVGQLLLKDFTVMKVMLTAIVVGAIGLNLFSEMGLLTVVRISKTTFLGSLLGGGLFGVGMALLGFCPGTGIAALADGAEEMLLGLLGMFVGTALYAEVFPWITRHLKPTDALGEETLIDLTGWSPWIFVGGISCMTIIAFALLEKKKA